MSPGKTLPFSVRQWPIDKRRHIQQSRRHMAIIEGVMIKSNPPHKWGDHSQNKSKTPMSMRWQIEIFKRISKFNVDGSL